MYLEYCNYNIQDTLDPQEEMSKVFSMIDLGLQGFCTNIYHIREIGAYLPEGFTLSGVVDYPLGKADMKVRQHQAITYLNAGANAIDLVCNRFYLMMSKWEDLQTDIGAIKTICDQFNATLRVLINWKDDPNSEIAIFVAKLMREYGADIVLPCIGYHYEDFTDNLIVSYMIEHETEVPVICNGYMNSQKHLEQLEKANIFGMRVYPSNYKVVYNI